MERIEDAESHKDRLNEDHQHEYQQHEHQAFEDGIHEHQPTEDWTQEDLLHEDQPHELVLPEDRTLEELLHGNQPHEGQRNEHWPHKDLLHEDQSHKDQPPGHQACVDQSSEGRLHEHHPHDSQSSFVPREDQPPHCPNEHHPHEDQPPFGPSSNGGLQHVSDKVFRVAGEALLSIYNHYPPSQSMPPAHSRSQSEIGSIHDQKSSFQKLKVQMQKAWRWGGSSREQDYVPSFNPEVLANQKRQWYQLHSKSTDQPEYKEPTSLFEHFVIVGIHPEANLESVEDAFARRKKWEKEMAKSEIINIKALQHRGPSYPTLEPQTLFKYPPGRKLPMRLKDLSSFCFPTGVKPRLLERTPSLSELNELVYSQEHLGRDDLSFLFSLKVADNDTLYGVCLHVTEVVQRPPGIIGISSPLPNSSGHCCRFLVSAPRCYCLLTKVPFFELHYEMLNSIIAQERLNRITNFVTEISLASYVPSAPKHDHSEDIDYYPVRDYGIDWTAFAIPVDSAVTLAAAAAGIISDDEIPTSSPNSPESITASENSDKDGRKDLQLFDDCASETSEIRSDVSERLSYENGQNSPEAGTYPCARMERIGSFDNMFSPVRDLAALEDEEDDLFPPNEKYFDDDIIMEWARENKNDLLQIICCYHAMSLPERGNDILFQPLEHLQAVVYRRPPISALGFSEDHLDLLDIAEVNSKLAAAEEALALSIWTISTICRVLSLENILALLTGVLLEKQVVIVCPNLGVLSAIVLSLVPMIRPFQWQSLLLPVLPAKMLDFLDAPVPFIVGMDYQPVNLKMKTTNLVHVNVMKNQVKCHSPILPQYKELVRELGPHHARLAFQNAVARRHPVHRCNEEQAQAAMQFLTIMRHYLESFCSNLSSHSITSVQSNNDRVSLLLKDSFIDSFPSKDRSFIKLFVDTQLFSVMSDSHLSNFEGRHF